MTPNTEIVAGVLEAAGFLADGEPAPGLFLADAIKSRADQLDRRLRYEAILNPERLGAAAVFELNGSPCVYFASLTTEPAPEQIKALHRIAWNHGLAPLLWIITPTRVLLFDCYSRPTDGDLSDAIGSFPNDASGLALLRETAGREPLSTGRFWKEPIAGSIDRSKRVDSSLLQDLVQAEALLVAKGLPSGIAHSLLGRTIFVAYLVHRGILTEDFLSARFGATDLADIFASHSLTYDVFRWVNATFNGDLFPLVSEAGGSNEAQLVSDHHIATLRHLLSPGALQSDQLSLWQYDFSVIPVELISAVYEHFAHVADPEYARDKGMHYTPTNLVDLTLSEAMADLSNQARVLDLSCGSGVFLVEALRRLVARRIAQGEQRSRDLIRSTLRDCIFGVDVNGAAIQIAAFSLYLTALELDPSPQPPEELRFENIIGRNLFVADAFDTTAAFNAAPVFQLAEIDLVVGNPPWTRTVDQSAVAYCATRDLPIMRASTDQAFLWRCLDFVRPGGRIALVMAGKPFFSTSPQALAARRAIATRTTPRLLLDLSELRFERLFPTAQAPAVLLVADAQPAGSRDFLTTAHAEDNGLFKRFGVLEVPSDQTRQVRTSEVAAHPELLKAHVWGRARDVELLRRLRENHPTLDDWIAGMGWSAGQGFQKASRKDPTPTSHIGLPVLPAGALIPFEIDRRLLVESMPTHLHRARDRRIYAAPLLITPRGIGSAGFFCAFSNVDTGYGENYFGISGTPETIQQLHFVNAILNSSLITYLLFLTSGGWGVERDEVKPEEVKALPLPAGRRASSSTVRRILLLERALRFRRPSKQSKLLVMLDEEVANLFGLRRFEKTLVQDFVQVSLERWRHRARADAHRPATYDDLTKYCKAMALAFSAITHTLSERVVTCEPLEMESQGRAVVRLSVLDSRQPRPSSMSGLGDLSSELDSHLHAVAASGHSMARTFRLHRGQDIYLVKPLARRFWTESMALSDADAIIAESVQFYQTAELVS